MSPLPYEKVSPDLSQSADILQQIEADNQFLKIQEPNDYDYRYNQKQETMERRRLIVKPGMVAQQIKKDTDSINLDSNQETGDYEMNQNVQYDNRGLEDMENLTDKESTFRGEREGARSARELQDFNHHGAKINLIQTNTIDTTISKRNTNNVGASSEAARMNAFQAPRVGGQE